MVKRDPIAEQRVLDAMREEGTISDIARRTGYTEMQIRRFVNLFQSEGKVYAKQKNGRHYYGAEV